MYLLILAIDLAPDEATLANSSHIQENILVEVALRQASKVESGHGSGLLLVL